MAPLDIQQKNRQAYRYAKNGELEKSIELYREISHSHPDLPLIHFNLGCLLSKSGEDEQAIAAYERTLEIRPNYAPAWNNLGTRLCRRGDRERGMAAYEKALKTKPDSAVPLRNLALELAKDGLKRPAAELLQKYLDLRPDDAKIRRRFAFLLLGLDHYEQAVEEAGIVIAQDPKNYWSYILVSLGSGLMRTPKPGILAALKAIRLRPLSANGWEALMLCTVAYLFFGSTK